MKDTKFHALIVAGLVLGGSWTAHCGAPKGWFIAGSHPKEYEMSVDRDVVRSGRASAHLKSNASKTSGFGTLMQTFQADAFQGKRVRLSGFARSKDVSDWAGLWMRVDGPRGEALAFDNMQQRAIKATTDWTRYEIVLDVPAQAEQIACGLLLTGRGEAWMDDLKLEVVTKDVPTTAGGPGRTAHVAPVNLDFEQN